MGSIQDRLGLSTPIVILKIPKPANYFLLDSIDEK